MKAVFFSEEMWEIDYVKGNLPGIEVSGHVGSVQANPAATDPDAEIVSIFVNSRFGAAEMDRFPKLKVIAARSTGYDHIDMAEAKKRDILVTFVPSYGVHTVAEFAFALLLALSRKICDAHKNVSEQGSFSQKNLTGFDLNGKTMGVIGCGRIGQHTIKIAKGFEMNVVGYDAFHNDEMTKTLGFSYVDLDTLLAQSDVISIHTPLLPETHHLINMGNINKLKKGMYLINTARGPIVETAAIVKGLEEGIIAGAGLDTLEDEGDLSDEYHLLMNTEAKSENLRLTLENHYLARNPKVIMTAHVAYDTTEAIKRIIDTTLENIAAFNSGTPKNIVQ